MFWDEGSTVQDTCKLTRRGDRGAVLVLVRDTIILFLDRYLGRSPATISTGATLHELHFDRNFVLTLASIALSSLLIFDLKGDRSIQLF